MVAIVMLVVAARAQFDPEALPTAPSAGVAAENGPGTLWVNPANNAFEPDPSFGLLIERTTEDGPSAFAIAAGLGGVHVGVRNRRRVEGTDFGNDWAVDLSSAIKLPARISLGYNLGWHFADDSRNWVSFDLGAAWRPLPWLGIGAVSQETGRADPTGREDPRTSVGLAVRPLGNFAVVGGEWERRYHPDPADTTPDEDSALVTLRIRPLEGLYLRGSADIPFKSQDIEAVTFGAGIEIYVGGVGPAYHLSTTAEGTAVHTILLGTDEPGESIVRSAHRVPEIHLDHTPPYQPRLGFLSPQEGASWLDTLELLRRLEDDPSVDGLVITLGDANLPFSRARELRDRILALEANDKSVLAYLTGSPTNTDYYVASAATRIAMHPATDLGLTGIALELQNVKGLLDFVGVDAQYVKRSAYKSAPEMWTNSEPSDASLEMHEALLSDLYDELADGIASGRHQERSVVDGWIDNGPWSASGAKEAGLVDVLRHPDELDEELRSMHGTNVSRSDLFGVPQPTSPWEDPKQIGIVYVEGGIVPGKSSPGNFLSSRSTGSASVVQALDRARRDPDVAAIVMRVDSPGGSSFASDEIWRAVEKVKEKGKPIVVSMGDLAASGGYYVSAGADAIWASPTTLTGSIGVYSGKFSTEELQKTLGVETTLLAKGRNATLWSMSRPWDDLQRAHVEALVDETYTQFKSRVSDGRSLTPEKVEDVAQGRVWSGKDAVELGLVDHIGGFLDAIADAKRRAGLSPDRKVGLVTFSDGGFTLRTLAPSISMELLSQAHGPEIELMHQILGPLDTLWLPALYSDREHVWMMSPETIEVGSR